MSHYDFANLLGNVWGKLFPQPAYPPVPAAQVRDHAIRTLFDYLSMVEWRHEVKDGKSAASFTIDRARMYPEKPDDNIDAKFDSFVVEAGRGTTQDDDPPLGPPVVWEETFAKDLVLVEIGMYRETFKLEVWSSNLVHRRAVVAGMDAAFAPSGDFNGLYLKLPTYYNLWAWFSLESTTRFDDIQRESRRRYAVCEIELWAPAVIQVPIGYADYRYLTRVNTPDSEGVR